MPDSNYSSVTLLLHCDGSNGSTTFTDNSPSPQTVTPTGAAQISTAQSKWGGASAYIPGEQLSTSISVFNPGSSNWTIEAWIYWSVAGNSAICSNGSTNFGFYLDSNRWIVKINATNLFVTNWTPTLNTWYHIAAVRNGATTTVYANGVSVASGTSVNVPTLTGSFIIGRYSPQSYGFSGYMDDFRVTPGVARYTANFTPPTEAFPNSGPVLLIPTQGTLTKTGLTPALALGFAAAPTQGTLTFTGLVPKHSSTTFLGTPAQGSLAVSGLTPSLALGLAAASTQGALTITGLTPALALGFAAAPTQGTLTFTGLVPKHSSTTFMGTPAQGSLAVTGLTPSLALGFAAAPAIRQLTITGLTPDFANRLLHPIANHWISTHYQCVLTGAADSLPDLMLPISSFQTRMGADPFRVYLSVIVPNAVAYIAAINARPNGRLKVTRVYNYLDGSFQSFAMAEAPFDTLSTNQGGKSGTTGTLTGSETMAAVTAQSVSLYDPITRSSSAGGRRYRCRLDPRIRPLDTAVINGESFLVDNVLHIIDSQTAIMEISEKL